MESYKLVVHIRYFEFEDCAFVACGPSRTRDVPLLLSGHKDRKHSSTCWELGIHSVAQTRRNTQDTLVEINKLRKVLRNEAGVDKDWLESACKWGICFIPSQCRNGKERRHCQHAKRLHGKSAFEQVSSFR